MEIPNHVAIIMDGNGRWAQKKGRPRIYGHIKGARVAKEIITESAKIGIKSLTLYAFSTENWGRPADEVGFLMRLLHRYILKERASLIKENIRFSVIGNLDKLPKNISEEIFKSIKDTKNNTGLSLTFALNYGGRQEIVDIMKSVVEKAKIGQLNSEELDVEYLNRMFETASVSDPDLIIRSSGEKRLSNFLIWQSAYSELWFTETLWPDFTKANLHEALDDFKSRQRRFGKTDPQSEAMVSQRQISI